jgi:hypothetical protein
MTYPRLLVGYGEVISTAQPAASISRMAKLPGEADPDIAELVARHPERAELEPGPAAMSWDLTHVFIKPIPLQHAALQELLAEHDEPVVVLDDTSYLVAMPWGSALPGIRPVAVIGIDIVPLTVSAELLPYASVLVSNGSYRGVQQALRHGVPMVLAGQAEDKAEVTARTAWAARPSTWPRSVLRSPTSARPLRACLTRPHTRSGPCTSARSTPSTTLSPSYPARQK